jgi:hypothetical protein
MNVFMHGTIAAGFGVLKSKFDKDMAGPAVYKAYSMQEMG